MNTEFLEQKKWFEKYKAHYSYLFKNEPYNIYIYLHDILETKESGNLTYVNLGNIFYEKYFEFLNENLSVIYDRIVLYFESNGTNKEEIDYYLHHQHKVKELIYNKIKLQGFANSDIIANTTLKPNPYPNIFAGVDNRNYQLFYNYKKHIIDPYPDYSFIFQKMLTDNNRILKGVKHLEFIEWLNETKLISSNIYIQLKDKGFFAKQYLRKAERNNNYYLIVKDIFKQDI